ncbi:Gfo/Idh/MocA family protein [Halobacillus amylolyticus]|uniref:Gfo/Idh/MocA family oxidoreductase n=1 Tax=Halobacillus amylolyticus TaxID=2932259 RepID=A0ABY4H905_9BACI|nr:Gfo/Idh/MocA family oxidoreductase [Halobacillus amylolyticus]UOR11026.1 Gfo/Idh/MocA family oxidoreductase [Halobacillus amylolyticus]
MKWGILSTAAIAKKALIPALQRAEDAEVDAIASQNGKEREVAEEFGIPKAYSSYELLLADEEIEAVYIPLPNHLHKEWTIKAAEAGKHVLCEKPAALKAQDVEDMITACKQNQVYFLEAFMYQFHPQHERVKQLIEEGAIGDVGLVRASFSFHFNRDSNNIRLDVNKGGGALWDVGCYGIHSALHVLSQEVKNVNAVAHIDDKFGVDTTAVATLMLEDETIVQVDCSFDGVPRNEYEVIGTKGMIKVHDAYRPDKKDHQGIVTIQTENGTEEMIIEGDQYRLQVETFMNAIQRQESFVDYHRETVRYIEVMEDLQQLL